MKINLQTALAGRLETPCPQDQIKETTRAFVDYNDEMLESAGASRLTREQRDVLLGFLDAEAEDEPRLIEALQSIRKSWKWASRETTAK